MDMDLYLDSSDYMNAEYRTKEGKPVYSTESGFFSNIIKIKKLLAQNPDTWQDLAEIEIHDFHPDIIRFNGQEINCEEYFKEGDHNTYGKDHVFKGPDGKQYRWLMGYDMVELVQHDNEEVLVAKLHPKRHGIFHDKCDMRLEITEAGAHMQELIFLTCVFAEHQRREKKEDEANRKRTRKNLKMSAAS